MTPESVWPELEAPASPARVVAKWLGRSQKVAAQHYLMFKDHHFEEVVGGGRGKPLPGEGGQGGVSECSAKCDAIETRNATPQAPASAGAESQKMTEPAATTGVTAGSAGITPITEIGQVGDIGLEPMTPSLSS